MNMDPDPDFFEVNLAETSSAEEQELRDNLDVGVDIVDKYMNLVDTMGLRIDKVEFFDYLNQKFLKLNDLDLNDYILVGEAAEQLQPGEMPPGGLGGGGAGMPAGAGAEPGDMGGPEGMPLGGELGALPGGGVPAEGGMGMGGPSAPFESRRRRRRMVELRASSDTCKARIIREYMEGLAREKRARRKSRKVHEGTPARAKRITNLDLLAPVPHRTRPIRGAITEAVWKDKYGKIKMTTRAAIKSVQRKRKKLAAHNKEVQEHKKRIQQEESFGGATGV